MDLEEAENDLLDRIILYVSKDLETASVDNILKGLLSGGSTVDRDWVVKTLEGPNYQGIISKIDGDTIYFKEKEDDSGSETSYTEPTEKEKNKEKVSKMAQRQLDKSKD